LNAKVAVAALTMTSPVMLPVAPPLPSCSVLSAWTVVTPV
jgi:hypothetical protein